MHLEQSNDSTLYAFENSICEQINKKSLCKGSPNGRSYREFSSKMRCAYSCTYSIIYSWNPPTNSIHHPPTWWKLQFSVQYGGSRVSAAKLTEENIFCSLEELPFSVYQYLICVARRDENASIPRALPLLHTATKITIRCRYAVTPLCKHRRCFRLTRRQRRFLFFFFSAFWFYLFPTFFFSYARKRCIHIGVIISRITER